MQTKIHASLAALALSLGTAGAAANEVTEWNAKAATLVNEQSPMEQSRSLAIVQIAVHDALNAIEPRFTAHAFEDRVPNASARAAVASAAHDALTRVLPEPNAELEAFYAQALSAIGEGEAKRLGIELGRRSAERITSLRADDDVAAALTLPYVPGDDPGDYVATPPFDIVVGAGWGELEPFAMPRASTFRPPPPPALRGRRYAREYAEVKAIGVQSGSTRTPEQTEIADFWYESSSTGWNRIANVVAREQKLDLWDSARLLGLVNIATADGFINGFDAKYHFNYWRPITAIHAGDTDGNRRTEGDPAWTPYCATPPVPDYPSTHSVLGAAAATVLARYLGDRTAFTIDSLSLPGVTRSFDSFSQAARENGESRIYCGIHWRGAVEAGLEQGRKIGQYVFKKVMQRRKGRR